MTISFYSNFLNHHQLPFCKEMYKILGDDFKFIATEPVPEERLQMGYYDMSTMYPFSLNTYNSKEDHEKAKKLGDASDIVIIGSAPQLFIKSRLKSNKLTFIYSERIFKRGRWRVLAPRVLGSLILNHTINRNKKLYMLCASSYTSADFNLVGAYRNKTYKWGYFPEVKNYDLNYLMNKKKQNEIPKLLWVGRYLDWKHPDDAVKLALMLKKNKYQFTLDIIGTGPMASKLEDMVKKNMLHDEVKFLGSMRPEEVREHMERANIFLFTSDFNEGWGAVLNESMNSGCAVVASHAIGSVPFLVKNKENGIIYENGNINHLYQSVKYLLDDKEQCYRLGMNAYYTLIDTWNAKAAASRFIDLCEILSTGKKISYKDGPCSKAEIISQRYNY